MEVEARVCRVGLEKHARALQERHIEACLCGRIQCSSKVALKGRSLSVSTKERELA